MAGGKNSLKSWFVPGEHNSYHPHLLRPISLAVIIVAFVVIQLVCNLWLTGHPRVLGFATDINVDTLLQETNQQRAAANLGSLSLNTQLSQAATNKADDMFAANYWAHVSPTGETPWIFIENTGYKYAYAGENLAKDFNTSAGVMNGWMNSSEHRANILNTHYTDIGLAVKNGKLDGKDTTLVVALYATSATSLADLVTNKLIPNAAAATGSTEHAAGNGIISSLLAPVQNMSWPALLILVLLVGLALVYLNDYRVKLKLAGVHHHHSLSLVQASMLVGVIIAILATTKLGVIG